MEEIRLTDTHCHLTDPALQADLPRIVQEAAAQGVRRFIVPATQRGDWQQAIGLMQQRPSENAAVHCAIGIHPWYAQEAAEQDFAELETLLHRYPQIWLGETGLDFYNKNQTQAQREWQIAVFARQLAIAQKLQRRVIVHNLRATQQIVAAVKQQKFTGGGIAHAFSGSIEEAESLIRCGFYIGIGSLLLNPTAKKVRLAAAALPLDKIVLETDSPFMLGNTVNTPANVRKIAGIVADLRGITVAEVARQMEDNVNRLLAAV
ncbi:TatD DNase family protein [Neisseria perflava]|nr:TatD family hydrolase [Neisseria perflava]MCP1660355.1 TatD DNase family protein [Neisseria perflava]